MEHSSKSKLIAEFIGTAVLVLFGCGSAVIAGNEVGYLGISFAFGLTVLIMAYSIGKISGCHINPAVTIGMVVAGKMCYKGAVMYIIAQCLGAIAGAFILKQIAMGNASYDMMSLGQNGFGEQSPGGYNQQSAFIAEVILTAIFVFVILGVTACESTAAYAGLAIGLALVVIHIVGIPITGTSVNPARSFGPALLVGGVAMQQLWLFIIAPAAGAVLGAMAWKTITTCSEGMTCHETKAKGKSKKK